MNVMHSTYKKGFFDYFPAPQFLKMSTVGLAFSDEAIRIVEFLGNTSGYHLGRHGEIALEKGIIDGGYIHDIPALGRVLREIKNRKNLSFVKASLPEEKGYVFTVRVPSLPYPELRSAIEYKLEENAPVKASDVVFDFNTIPDSRDVDNTIEVAVSVLPLKAVSAYVEALKSAEIEPIAFEVESQAVARSVVDRNDTGVYIILNLFSEKAGLYLVSHGIVVFTSTILLDAEILSAKQTIPSFITAEIQKILLFWETQHEEKQTQTRHVSAVRMVGLNPDWEGIQNHLQSELTIPVEVGNVWTNAFDLDEYVPEIKKADSLRFAAAIGLALPISHE